MTATHVDKAIAKRRAYEEQVRVRASKEGSKGETGSRPTLRYPPRLRPPIISYAFTVYRWLSIQQLVVAGAEADKLNYTAGAEVRASEYLIALRPCMTCDG